MSSKLGWILAGVIAVAVVVFVCVIVLFPSTSAPTYDTLRQGALDKQDLPAIGAIVGAAPKAKGNAADDYILAVQACRQNPKIVADLAGNMDRIRTKRLSLTSEQTDFCKSVDQHVAAGSDKADMKYLLVCTPKQLKVTAVTVRFTDGPDRPLKDFKNIGVALEALAAQYYNQKDYAAAIDVLRHEFMLGYHLINERALVPLVYQGIGLQTEAMASLNANFKAVGTDYPAKYQALKDYQSGLEALRISYGDIDKFMRVAHPNPGDVFNVAENHNDRAWRAQAMLVLGPLKQTAGSRGDVKYARKVLEKAAESSDSVEAAAAKAALDMSPDQFNTYATDND